MKYLFTLIISLIYLSFSYSQTYPKKVEGKPDFKETAQFIKAKMNNSLFTEGIEWRKHTYPILHDTKYIHVHIHKMNFLEDCKLDIGYTVQVWRTAPETQKRYGYNHRVESFVIDFSKIESIQLENWEHNDASYGIYGIYFKTYLKSEPRTMHLPIGIYPYNGFYDSQILKAFEHIRKMCGAPEPISF